MLRQLIDKGYSRELELERMRKRPPGGSRGFRCARRCAGAAPAGAGIARPCRIGGVLFVPPPVAERVGDWSSGHESQSNIVDLNLQGHAPVSPRIERHRARHLPGLAATARGRVHYSTSQAQAAEVVEEIRRGGRASAIQGDLRQAMLPGVVTEAVRPRPSTFSSTTPDR